MRRRTVFFIVGGLVAGSATSRSLAVGPATSARGVATLEESLIASLGIPKTDKQPFAGWRAFVESLVAEVRAGRLPEELVRSTCDWAVYRSRQRGARYPFPSFAAVMRLKASRLGVKLPPPA